jgi:hypothetical protein
MAEDEAAMQPEVLVELIPAAADAGSLATEAGDDGRFRLDGVRAGIYQLTLTPVHGAQVIIDRLEIG